TRGSRLVLTRAQWSGPDQRPEAFHTEVLSVVEINADGRIGVRIWFDANDFDAAVAELDARYLAGEAGTHAHMWSVITQVYAAMNRHELPATTPDWVNIDHRRGRAFEPGDMTANIRAAWDLTPDISFYFEAVHRLSNLGAVVTSATHGTAHDGFHAEWRQVDLVTVEGDLINHCEIFDEADIDAAIARFEELHPQTRRLDNTAARVNEHFAEYFAARDWAAVAEILSDDNFLDDRRHVVNGGLWHGRDAVIEYLRAVADFTV